jgi:hypothetical protein
MSSTNIGRQDVSELLKLANRFLQVLTEDSWGDGYKAPENGWGAPKQHPDAEHRVKDNNSVSDTSSMFAVSITTVDPKRSRAAMLSFMHQLESSPYRAMIKYVQDHRNDGTLLIAFREPMSKEAVLKICNSLSLSFSQHDNNRSFIDFSDDELIVTDIDVESYSVYPVKETLAFTIVAKSSEDASALADELKRFARIKDTRVQGNVVQVTFKESSSASELRSMCEKLSRIYKSINQIDIQSLTIGER